jgi:hypothetical protein
VWQRLWLLAIQLMTRRSPVAHQYGIRMTGDCFSALGMRMSRRMSPTCGFVTMAPLFFFFF